MAINQDEDVGSLLITKDQEQKSSAGVFGLHPELKIAKEEDGGMDFNGDQCENNENGKARVCGICGKEFSSGKGLGGHMRIHTEQKDLKKHKPKQKPRDDDSVKKKDHICPVCGKAFWSLKSVSGHMRCHPERDWRGIQPPPNHTASSTSSSLSDADQIGEEKVKITTVDLTQSLKKWPVKAKRGRMSSEDDQVLDPVSSEDDKKVLGAVNQLMNLSRDKMLSMAGQSQNGNDLKSSIPVNGESDDDDQMKKRKKMKLCDLKSDKFKCHTCDKSFPTHQALGGHCSSHNKLSINAKLQARDDHKTSNESGLVDELQACDDHKTSTPSSEETIRMGQARDDYESRLVEAPSSEETIQARDAHYENGPSSEETSHMGSQKVFVIDLNELPPSEDEAGYGSQLACAC